MTQPNMEVISMPAAWMTPCSPPWEIFCPKMYAVVYHVTLKLFCFSYRWGLCFSLSLQTAISQLTLAVYKSPEFILIPFCSPINFGFQVEWIIRDITGHNSPFPHHLGRKNLCLKPQRMLSVGLSLRPTSWVTILTSWKRVGWWWCEMAFDWRSTPRFLGITYGRLRDYMEVNNNS